jgi:hypothetical protein
MPRNSSGVYTLPAGNPVVDGTIIETTWANPTMDDIASALTGSLPRNGSAGMNGPLLLAGDAVQPTEAVALRQVVTVTGAQTITGAKTFSDTVAFNGAVTAPTPTAGDNDTSVATTAFVTTAIAATGGAPINSPTFTGDPKAPTPTSTDNDTSIATTAFVKTAIAAIPPAGNPSGSITTSGYTMTTDKLLGRDTNATGAIEEITVGSGLTLSGGVLTTTVAPVTGRSLIKYTEILATNAVWAKQAATTAIEVLCVGGGSGGAKDTTVGGLGGMAGEQVRGYLDTGLTATFNAVIGAGSAGATTSGVTSAAGGTTSFSTSTPATIASALGGLGGKGSLNGTPSGNGETGVKRGGAGGTTSGTVGGSAGANSGGGGGGATNANGGAGGSGIIYVWEYA